ncbi:hypothetical protein ACKGJN_05655 [Gillisia sp. Q332]|uniref:glucosamine inositolphosphorylceramide transferase family protein n=1 Tax=Gillisia xinjiangensis TaxID=3384765 RepID=UPI00391D27E6
MKRIGILMDDLKMRSWQKKIIQHIIEHDELELSVLIINKNKSEASNSGFFYRFFQAVDRKMFKVANDAFLIKNFVLDPKIPTIEIHGIETRFSYRFSDEDVIGIKELNLDVLIRFGFGILKGGILDAARFGVWSLHHGDNKINRGGPPGFWEVVNKESVTGVTLQRLSSDLDGGIVIDKAFTKTNFTSFNRNKNEVFWSGVELFNSALDNLARGKSETMASLNWNNKRFYSMPLYKTPLNYAAISIHLSFWIRRIKEILLESLNPPQWFLLYKFKSHNETETSIFRYKKLVPPKGYDWADPFVVKKDEEGFYMFFEELNMKTRKGYISYFYFDKVGKLINNTPRKVIEEDYHLSYPFVFKENNNFYIIPESASSGELWLYKCIKFPDEWQKEKRIFKDKPFYDATLIKHQDYYYLFGTEKVISESARDQYLFIYYSKDLMDDTWLPHPSNPIYKDVRRARPAGRIFELGGKLVRPAQIGAPKYGYGIQFNEIKILSPTTFEEIRLEQILPNWEKNLLATHTFNSVEGFTVLDAQGYINRKH